MSRHRHRAAILDRDAEDLGLTAGQRGQLVGKRGCQNGHGRAAVAGSGFLRGIDLGIGIHIRTLGQKAIVGIFDVVGRDTGRTVEPDVADHPVGRGVCAGCQGHVADDGLRVRMAMMRVVVVNALLEQVAQTALAEPVGVARRQVAPELVDGDLEDEFGLVRYIGADLNGLLSTS